MMNENVTKEQLPNSFNEFGESPLPGAPVATLSNGQSATPQQFLHYCRTVENVENVVSLISFSDDFPIFVFKENDHIFLQVGIVGHENYPPITQSTKLSRNDKIVYGRKWYIEPFTPTSEVIQTALLAINKVREHELRELFTFSVNHNDKMHKATPFNSHIDLPLAAKCSDLFVNNDSDIPLFEIERQLNEKFQTLSLGTCNVALEESTLIHKPYWLIGVSFPEKENENCRQKSPMSHYFPELSKEKIYFISHANSLSNVLHDLMNAIIKKCEKYVSNTFSYNGFKRFSHDILPDDLAKFSIDTRLGHGERTADFNEVMREMIHLVDSSKAPEAAKCTELLDKQEKSLNERNDLEGYLPRGVDL